MDRMKQLVNIINEHNYNYYVLDNPTISDKEWDLLYDELLDLEKQTGIVLPDSPSNKVGGEVLKNFKKYVHKVPLYSLNKVREYSNLKNWFDDVKEVVPNASFVLDYKYDGLSVVIHYKNGILISAGTRGNGQVGEDVTQQVKTIRTVPLSIDYKGELIVQGECIMKLSELKKYNKTNKEILKNARNAAAGALRNLDPKVTKSRNLDIIFYSINYIEDNNIKTQIEAQQFLIDNKFYVVKDTKEYHDFESLEKDIKQIDISKNSFDFLIDGAVVKLNNIALRDELGYTSKFPKWAMAFKFEAEEISTKLLDVVWTVGRTGKVTPGAILEPVELAGATVRRATLNNYEDILRKKVSINSYVFVRRSNEVIPEVLGLARETDDTRKIEKITNCPCCSSELKEIGPNLFCLNTYECKEQIVQRISHYASRDAMNLVGISEKTVEQMFDILHVRSIADLYSIKEADLFKLEGFKDKKASNTIKSIENSKKVALSKFIYAIGILNIGKKTARELANRFKTFKNLLNATKQELVEMQDIGEVIADCIIEYFKNENNLKIIKQLFDCGVVIEELKQNKIKENYFTNKTIVLTGTLTNYKRDELTSILSNLGANVTTSVSKNTDLVIVGENAGSKLDKAKKLNIEILNETALKEKLDNI